MIVSELLEGRNVWPNTKFVLEQQSKNFEGKRVIVTGACGTIGRALTEHLSDSGAHVIAVDFNEFKISEALKSTTGADWTLSDYEDFEIPSDTHYIFHCAAFKHVDLSFRFEKSFIQNNAEKFNRWLGKSKIELGTKVVLVSSDKAAGKSPLGMSKKLAEEYVVARKGVALRLVNTVRSQGSVIDIWDRSKFPWVCPGHVERYWMSITDAIRAIIQIARFKSGTYTVQNVPMFTMGDMASAYEGLYGKKIGVRNSLRIGESDKENLISSSEAMENVTPEIARVIQA